MKAVLSRLSLLIVAMSMLFASCEKESGSETNQPEGGNNNPEVAGNTINGHEYVDLGLPSGLKWATCNIGATNPEDFGNYYAWGETSTKNEYLENNCTTAGVDLSEISGDAQHDAARAKWGSTWRLPTAEEFEELTNMCTWTWVTQNNVNGMKVTGQNGKSIFIPATGYRFGSSLNYVGEYGYFWSSTTYTNNNNIDKYNAYYLGFLSGGHSVSWGNRSYGYTIRPVSN